MGLSSFTPLENSTIYGRDIKRKCSFIIGGVKAPSFLTGFTCPVDILHEYLSQINSTNCGKIKIKRDLSCGSDSRP